MFVNLIHGSMKGPRVGNNPWGGTTLEWSTPSPPPHENFETEPVVTQEPYYHEEALTK